MVESQTLSRALPKAEMKPRVVQQSETGQAPSLRNLGFSAACEVVPFPRTCANQSFSTDFSKRAAPGLLQSLPEQRAHCFLAGGRVGGGVRSQRKVVAFQFVTPNMVGAGTRLVPRYVYVVGDSFGLAVDRIRPGIGEHAPDYGFCFVGRSDCTCRFLTVSANNDH